MNKNETMTKYLKSLAGLTSAPETLVQISIGGTIMSMTLAEIPSVLKAAGLVNALPNAVMVNGVKTGAFPVIEPKTVGAALALSSVVGYPVPLGDGVRFCTQSQARYVAKALLNLGTSLDELVMEWQLGRPRGATAAQMELPMSHGTTKPSPFTQAQRDAASETPF